MTDERNYSEESIKEYESYFPDEEDLEDLDTPDFFDPHEARELESWYDDRRFDLHLEEIADIESQRHIQDYGIHKRYLPTFYPNDGGLIGEPAVIADNLMRRQTDNINYDLDLIDTDGTIKEHFVKNYGYSNEEWEAYKIEFKRAHNNTSRVFTEDDIEYFRALKFLKDRQEALIEANLAPITTTDISEVEIIHESQHELNKLAEDLQMPLGGRPEKIFDPHFDEEVEFENLISPYPRLPPADTEILSSDLDEEVQVVPPEEIIVTFPPGTDKQVIEKFIEDRLLDNEIEDLPAGNYVFLAPNAPKQPQPQPQPQPLPTQPRGQSTQTATMESEVPPPAPTRTSPTPPPLPIAAPRQGSTSQLTTRSSAPVVTTTTTLAPMSPPTSPTKGVEAGEAKSGMSTLTKTLLVVGIAIGVSALGYFIYKRMSKKSDEKQEEKKRRELKPRTDNGPESPGQQQRPAGATESPEQQQQKPAAAKKEKSPQVQPTWKAGKPRGQMQQYDEGDEEDEEEEEEEFDAEEFFAQDKQMGGPTSFEDFLRGIEGGHDDDDYEDYDDEEEDEYDEDYYDDDDGFYGEDGQAAEELFKSLVDAQRQSYSKQSTAIIEEDWEDEEEGGASENEGEEQEEVDEEEAAEDEEGNEENEEEEEEEQEGEDAEAEPEEDEEEAGEPASENGEVEEEQEQEKEDSSERIRKQAEYREKLQLLKSGKMPTKTTVAQQRKERAEGTYVGLQNLGATCYLNSLLQTLYHLAPFRKAVYEMDTRKDNFNESITLALQRVFFQLQTHGESVSTSRLTQAFGWTKEDSFIQHDVQELSRLLFEQLEKEDAEKKLSRSIDKSMKRTISKLFEGKVKNYIKCINVDCESSRTETFSDLQLDVRGCRDVYASFRQYMQQEKLVGENQYRSDQFGLQDAIKGCIFESFPPVLMLHLKRFQYDPLTNQLSKVNDPYQFYPEIDLDDFVAEDQRHGDNVYSLFSVLVHSGSAAGGHYYAFIKTNPDSDLGWHKFDDTRVSIASPAQAIDGNFGGLGSYTSAYMLVYVRKSQFKKLQADGKTIPEHLRQYFLNEPDNGSSNGTCSIM